MVKEIATNNTHPAPPSLEFEVAQNTVEVCKHHWLIDTPQGPTSAGRCKNCGSTKDFNNSSRYLIEASFGHTWRKMGFINSPSIESTDNEYNGF